MMQTRTERFFYRAMNLVTWNTAGSALAISGATLSVLGIVINNVYLLHHTAMLLWLISNPVLLIWAIGVVLKKWNGGLSMEAIAAMYLIAFVTGAYGLWLA